MKKLWQTFARRLSAAPDRIRRLLILAGVIGVALIALSEFLPKGEDPPPDPLPSTAEVTVTAQQVEQSMERRIGDLLSAVEGVGRCRVMVTLDSDSRSVYAADTTTSVNGEHTTSGENVLTVDTDTGPVGLLLTRIQPTVKGVVVVCDGGSDPVICQRVAQIITTAFHISDRRVCVVQQKEGGNGQ